MPGVPARPRQPSSVRAKQAQLFLAELQCSLPAMPGPHHPVHTCRASDARAESSPTSSSEGLPAEQLSLLHPCCWLLMLWMWCFAPIPPSAPLSHPAAAVRSPLHCGTGRNPLPANPFCLSHEKIGRFPGFVPDGSILAKFISLLPFWVPAGAHVSLCLGDGGYAGLCFPLQPLHRGAGAEPRRFDLCRKHLPEPWEAEQPLQAPTPAPLLPPSATLCRLCILGWLGAAGPPGWC